MGILFNEKEKIFKLDTKNSSYIMKVYDEGYLLCLYYGKKIPDYNLSSFETRPLNASFSTHNPHIETEAFSPDTAPLEYGCNGAGDFRISAIAVRNANGDSVTDLRYKSHRIYEGKPEIPQMPATYLNSGDKAETLEIDTFDKVTGLEVTLRYTVFGDYPVITKSVVVKNTSEKDMFIERAFSACFDFPTMDFDMITLYGRHARERHIERRALAHGIQGAESKRGASSHSQNPFAAFVKHGTDEESGEAYGFNLVYSGNFSALAECDHNFTTRFIMGINPTDFEWKLCPGEEFFTPEAVCVYSDSGIGEMSRIFHRFYNNNLIRGKYKTEKRPLLINNWEATSFNIDTDTLVAFAESVKDLGVEMLVMDDGWFGKRNNSKTSLGDWFVNEEKLPGGLKPLISRVNALGLKFGIWFEPEMVSPDAKLLSEHPDWHVHVAGREPMLGRHQYVLDVSREDVRENVKQQMSAILDNNNIDYIKWDFNRNISDAGSALLPPERSKEFFHRFVLGTYDLMNWLVTKYPDLLFENCSGGGGRFDPAMLYYSPQIWTSDDTNPIERLYIQFGTSMCYPASTMGAHVSARYAAGYETKANVALWGTFGYELDPRNYSEEEREQVRRQVKDYHKYYDLIRNGDLYRLISPFENKYKAAWEITAADKSDCLVTVVCIQSCEKEHFVLKLKGLEPDAYYTDEESGEVYSGALLMYAGIDLSERVNVDSKSIMLHFVKK